MAETFIFKRSDGTIVDVTADTLTDAMAKLRIKTPAEITADIGKGLQRGGVSAVAGVPGVFGDLQRGVEWLGEKVGKQPFTPEQRAIIRQHGNYLPTTSDIFSSIEQNITGPLPKPETWQGQYAESIATHGLGALGPGGPARKLIGGVALPGVVSETLGRSVPEAYEPYARFGGSLAGGFVGTRQAPAFGGRAGAERTVAEMFDKGDLSRLRELGPQSFMFEANPSLERVMSGVLQRPGPASTRAVDDILARHEKAPKRLAKEYTEAAAHAAEKTLESVPPHLRGQYKWASGEPVVPSEFLDGLKQQKRALGPQYETAIQGAAVVDLTPAASYAGNMFPRLSGPPSAAMKEAADIIYPLDAATGQRRLRTNADEVLSARQALDDQLTGMDKGTNAHRLVTHMRDLVDKQLAAAAPGIKAVDRQYAHLAQQEGDFALGQRMLRTQGDQAMNPADVRAYIAKVKGETTNDAITILGRNAPPDQLLQLADRMYAERLGAIQAGIRSDLDRIAGTSIYDVTALKRAVQTEGDWNYQKLQEVFGNTAANRIFRATNREAEFGRVYNDMLRNSMTAQRQVAERMTNIMESGSGPGMDVTTGLLVGALTGEPVSAMAAGAASATLRAKAKQFARAITAGGQRRLDDALVDILLTRSVGGRGKEATALIDALMANKAAGPSWLRTLGSVGLSAESGSLPLRITVRPEDRPPAP